MMAVRAVAVNNQASRLVGISVDKISALAFALGGAVFGMGEEIIPFVLMLVPVMTRLGYDRVTVVLVDQRSDYQVHDAGGETVADVPTSAPRRWRVTLVPDSGADAEVKWRMESVEALA